MKECRADPTNDATTNTTEEHRHLDKDGCSAPVVMSHCHKWIIVHVNTISG
jgi:hypothetical protein